MANTTSQEKDNPVIMEDVQIDYSQENEPICDNASGVIEMNPGLGMITKELLDAGVPFIHLYQKEEKFVKRLNNLQDEFPKRLPIEHANLYNISRMMNVDSTNTKLLGVEEAHLWQRHVLNDVQLQTFWLPREEFVPWHRNRAMKNRRRKYALDIYTDDINALYVVKLEPKPDLFTLFKKKQDLIDFWRFVRHNLYKPSYRVIPVMEKIMSGCGFDLIKKNYDIFTQFNDLTASQIYDLHQSRTVYSCQVRLMLQQHTLYITTKNMTSEETVR